jgi:Asp/Glu/hydantoin racemase
VVTSTSGPSAIETDEDVSASIEPMLTIAASQPSDAIVVACFSDPGLDRLRDQNSTPVFGIAESAIEVALTAGNHIGVISSMTTSIPRHERYWKRLGVSESIAADIPLGLGVLELDTPEAESRAVQAGIQLIDAGADVIVLGCTGLTHMQENLGEMLGVPVVDPCLAAVETAEMTLSGRSVS